MSAVEMQRLAFFFYNKFDMPKLVFANKSKLNIANNLCLSSGRLSAVKPLVLAYNKLLN